MHFDPKALEALLSQDDATLWKTISAVAARSGVPMSKNTPSAQEMKKLRETLTGVGKMRTEDAEALLKKYKESGNGNG